MTRITEPLASLLRRPLTLLVAAGLLLAVPAACGDDEDKAEDTVAAADTLPEAAADTPTATDTVAEMAEDTTTDVVLPPEVSDAELPDTTAEVASDTVEADVPFDWGDDPGTVPTKFFVGYGEVDVSPPDGIPLGGFGPPTTTRVSEGVHDPLMAQVAIFQNDAGQAMIIITFDAAGFFFEYGDWGPAVQELRQSIADALAGTVDLQPEHILLGSSHSHGATDFVGFWQQVDEGVDKDLIAEVHTKVTQAAVDAAGTLQEAAVSFGHGELVGYTGRDDNCSEILDNSVEVIQAKSLTGDVIVTITNYAKHPTMMGSDNQMCTADFIWGYREEMKLATGAPAMYLQGHIAAVHGGELSPPGDGWDKVYNMGAILADKVLEITETLTPADDFYIKHRWQQFTSEVGEGSYMILGIEYLGIPKRTYHQAEDGSYVVDIIEASWHKLGPAEITGFPGEGDPEYGMKLKKHMTSEFKFVVGLANDEIGYIVDPEAVANDPSGRLESYELKMGLGLPIGPHVWEAHQAMGWFDGALD